MQWLQWSLLSAVFAALTAILAKVGLQGINSNLATAWRTTVVLLFVWAIALVTNKGQPLTAFPGRAWLFLALSGIATGLSWLCYFRALQLGDASRVAPIDRLSVVLVMVFGVLVLGEHMTWKTVAGGVLITAGAVLVALK